MKEIETLRVKVINLEKELKIEREDNIVNKKKKEKYRGKKKERKKEIKRLEKELKES